MAERFCRKCNKKLRANNSGDDCWSCRKGQAGDGADEAPPPRPGRRTRATSRS